MLLHSSIFSQLPGSMQSVLCPSFYLSISTFFTPFNAKCWRFVVTRFTCDKLKNSRCFEPLARYHDLNWCRHVNTEKWIAYICFRRRKELKFVAKMFSWEQMIILSQSFPYSIILGDTWFVVRMLLALLARFHQIRNLIFRKVVKVWIGKLVLFDLYFLIRFYYKCRRILKIAITLIILASVESWWQVVSIVNIWPKGPIFSPPETKIC